MRLLLTGILLAAAAWSGYWFWGAATTRGAMEDWFQARRGDGWVAAYDNLAVRGFPNRFDISFSNLSLADPDTGLAWDAPFFQVLALSYRPNHVIAVWPDNQKLATPFRKYGIQNDDMRASFVFRPGVRLEVERGTLTTNNLRINPGSKYEESVISDLTLAAEHAPADASATYRLGLSADGFAPPQDLRDRIAVRDLPETLNALSADLTVRFDKPWDRRAIEEARPQPRHLFLRLAEARWGHLELQAAGELDVGSDGIPEGTITIKARNWPEIMKLARSSRALPEAMLGPLERGLSLLSRMSGNPRTLDIPLRFSGGDVSIGPIPVMAAPVLRIR
ncbi:DUF2125 domain-containing protein [Roseovarius sp. TE539]|uniref:DUF2125 domain-containing protein n=1 Tax=Roseovarius sp. TE539 TaxID=2249812 RepID=UPI000DDEA9A8|nr:DUF2125 domain-containing protein [Roseovarius sp. TE539]RBI72692.1 DUF2125 domain-containing protein [Roseovarius sp. TE539]